MFEYLSRHFASDRIMSCRIGSFIAIFTILEAWICAIYKRSIASISLEKQSLANKPSKKQSTANMSPEKQTSKHTNTWNAPARRSIPHINDPSATQATNELANSNSINNIHATTNTSEAKPSAVKTPAPKTSPKQSVQIAFTEDTVWRGRHPYHLDAGDAAALDVRLAKSDCRYDRDRQDEVAYMPSPGHEIREPGGDFILPKGQVVLNIMDPKRQGQSSEGRKK